MEVYAYGNLLKSKEYRFYGAIRSEIYVDKTGLITYTNRYLNTEQKYICVSRPRRFGKSMALKMLVGINYDKANENKPHTCVIEKIKKNKRIKNN